jgi:hypothetical protein
MATYLKHFCHQERGFLNRDRVKRLLLATVLDGTVNGSYRHSAGQHRGDAFAGNDAAPQHAACDAAGGVQLVVEVPAAAPSGALRRQRLGVQRSAFQVLKRDCHGPGFCIDVHLAEELHAAGWRSIHLVGGFLVHHLHAKGGVRRVGTKTAGIERARDKFPER